MTPSRLALPILCTSAFPSSAFGQAGLEYAARSAGGALSKAGDMHLGVCRLDSAVATCVQRYYPAQFYVAVLAACVLLCMLLFQKRSA